MCGMYVISNKAHTYVTMYSLDLARKKQITFSPKCLAFVNLKNSKPINFLNLQFLIFSKFS